MLLRALLLNNDVAWIDLISLILYTVQYVLCSLDRLVLEVYSMLFLFNWNPDACNILGQYGNYCIK